MNWILSQELLCTVFYMDYAMPGHRLVDYESHWSLDIFFLILGEEAFLPLKIGKYNTNLDVFI